MSKEIAEALAIEATAPVIELDNYYLAVYNHRNEEEEVSICIYQKKKNDDAVPYPMINIHHDANTRKLMIRALLRHGDRYLSSEKEDKYGNKYRARISKPTV